MKDLVNSGFTGAGSSSLAMMLGLIDVPGLLNAFLVGVVGALGGILVHYIKKRYTLWRSSRNDSRDSGSGSAVS